jgi:hypothetical protein
MARRLQGTALVSLGLVLPLAGCESHRSWLRPGDHGDTTTATKDPYSDTSKIPSVDSDSHAFQPFFKNDRRSGGWSSEARDIEKDLGVRD